MSGSNKIYHMCLLNNFLEQTNNAEDGTGTYFPPTYGVDGFIHATKEATLLLDIANHFYTDSVGDWICIEIEPSLLPNGAESVVYEAAAPVGDKTAYESEQTKFPHIYGGISAASVVRTLKIERSADGRFVAIEGL